MTVVRSLTAWFFILLVGASAVSLGACNTAEGVGKDVEAAGEKVQDVAK